MENVNLFLNGHPEQDIPASQPQDIKAFVGRGRWVDFSKIRMWLRNCDANHGQHCQGFQISFSGNMFKPHWAIDVKRSCIVPYDETLRAEYVALSYVWGTAPKSRQLELLRSNLDELRLDGALDRHSDRIPAAILTAMAVTLRLGYHYLWVDRLCIIQDEAATKHSQIYHMATIYSSASLTIVATETAEQPLWGTKPLENARSIQLPIITGPWKWSFTERLKSSTWNTRAWTFQELLFSRRAIVFFENALHCLCHCGETEYSELPAQKPVERTTQLLGEYQLYGWPDLATYTAMVKDYVRRKVSVEIDFLNAYTGLSTTLSRGFYGIHYGLPEVFFDVALLWYPACSTSPTSPGRYPLSLRRRSPPPNDSEPNPLPSWSWMGWYEPYGRLDFWYWLTVNPAFVMTSESRVIDAHSWQAQIKTSPIIEWHMELRPEGKNLPSSSTRRVRANLLEYTTAPAVPDPEETLLPPGWRASGNAFVHSCDPDTKFTHPVPISDEPALDESTFQEKSPFPILKFNAARAWFCIDDPSDPYLRIPDGNTTDPLNVGYLWIHDDNFREQLQDDTWANIIAISEAQIPRSELNDKTFWAREGPHVRWSGLVQRVLGGATAATPRWRAPKTRRMSSRSNGVETLRLQLLKELRADPVYFYNVLCIRGANGRVVERVGIGTVLKSAFDVLAGEEPLEVRLG